jgi:thiamine transport system substrate-binding protein
MKHNKKYFFNRNREGRTSVALCCISAFAVFALLFSCKGKGVGSNAEKDLAIWTYDSFVSEWGPGQQIAGAFAEQYAIRVNWENSGDAGALLARLLLEGRDAKADIILGLDQNLMPRALRSDLFESYKPHGVENISPELIVDTGYKLIPFDYSCFAIIIDTEKIKTPPGSLEDLTSPAYKNALILMDPRTSSPGLGFLGWTIDAYKDAWPAYWERLRPSILTVAPGWDTGYGLFTRGEAPLVLSYTTSPGYHLEYEGTGRYRAAIFADGHPVQIELAGLLKAAPHKENAKLFLDFMLSAGFQDAIPLTNWMYPVIDIPLPASYDINIKPSKTFHPAPVSEDDLNKWVSVMR